MVDIIGDSKLTILCAKKTLARQFIAYGEAVSADTLGEQHRFDGLAVSKVKT